MFVQIDFDFNFFEFSKQFLIFSDAYLKVLNEKYAFFFKFQKIPLKRPCILEVSLCRILKITFLYLNVVF